MERATERVKIWGNAIDFPSLLKFSKLCLMLEANIITLPEVVLHVCRGDI